MPVSLHEEGFSIVEHGCSQTVSKRYGDKVYWHINNGGIVFSLEQRTWKSHKTDHTIVGPVFRVGANHFGCQTNGMELPTNKASLLALANLLLQYAQDESIPETHDCAMCGITKRFDGPCEDDDEETCEKEAP